jgi:hypothetical protein
LGTSHEIATEDIRKSKDSFFEDAAEGLEVPDNVDIDAWTEQPLESLKETETVSMA